jgi:hypothetical protein
MRPSRPVALAPILIAAALSFAPLAAQGLPAGQHTSAAPKALTTNPELRVLPKQQAGPTQLRDRKAAASDLLARTTASFIENRGQFDARAKFQLTGEGTTVWLTNASIIFDIARTKPATTDTNTQAARTTTLPAIRTGDRLTITEELISARPNPTIQPEHVRPGVYNFFAGTDPRQWVTKARSYAQVVYKDVWNNIDLLLRSSDGASLEQEFLIRPGGDPSQVHVAYRGADQLTIAPDGALAIHTSIGDLRESPPRIYQDIAGKHVPIDGRYRLTADGAYTFDIGSYDPQYTLVIDPTLLYSTYLGGTSSYDYNPQQFATAIAVDSAGNSYVTGQTNASDFPTTPGAIQTSGRAFITKLDPLGKNLVYSTYLYTDVHYLSGNLAIAVNPSGQAYITGLTYEGSMFPTTANAFQGWCGSYTNGGSSAFITVLDGTGGLLYSSCLGQGAAQGHGVAVDTAGNAYITGSTQTQFPTTPGAYEPNYPPGNPPYPPGNSTAFVAVVNPSLTGAASLVYSTYLGGGDTDTGNAIAVDAYKNVYVTGTSNGPHFPVTPGAYQTYEEGVYGDNIAFLAKLNPTVAGPSGLIYATYLGGDSTGTGVAVDTSGSAYVTGSYWPAHALPFPTTPGAFRPCLVGAVFVTKFNAAGNGLSYSTCLGGPSGISGMWPIAAGPGLALDALGNAYVTGAVSQGDFPVTTDAYQPTSHGGNEAFITELNSSGSGLVYSSYLGGSSDDRGYAIALDPTGDAYITGFTASSDFPVTQGVYQPTMKGVGNAFITKFPLGGTLRALQIFPVTAGTSGSLTLTVDGSGFRSGANVKLAGTPDIVATSISIGLDGTHLTAGFNVQNVTPGRRDLVITNPDGTTATLPQALTIVQGGAPQLWVQLVGSPVIRFDAPSHFQVLFGNSGNLDAHDVILTLTLPPSVQFSLGCPAPSAGALGLPWTAPPDWCQIPVSTTDDNGNNLVPIWLLNLGSGTTAIIDISITVIQRLPDNTKITVLTAALGNAPTSTFSATGDINQLSTSPTAQAIADAFAQAVGSGADVPALVIHETAQSPLITDQQALQLLTDLATRYAKWWDHNETLQWWVDATTPAGGASAGAWFGGMTGEAAAAGFVVGDALVTINEAMVLLGRGAYFTNQYNNAMNQALAKLDAQLISAGDPNAIVGPKGTASVAWLSATQPLTYDIFFANEQTASAPAQTVLVTNPLDPDVDPTTLVLTGISIPGVQVPIPPSFNPPAGLNTVSTSVDLRPSQNLFVSIQASLNPATRLLTWTFTSIDPITGLPTTDPSAGFLPPGTGGSVAFTVAPNLGSTTGTQVSDQGTVVFDANPPMNTMVWANTLDSTPPTSHVAPFGGAYGCLDFKVKWSGADVGAGIQDYTVYVSDTGGPFAPWLTNTPVATATYQGWAGHSYGFYSVARDRVGNVEASKTTAEATIQVVSKCGGPPSLTGTATVQSLSGKTLTVALQITNNGTGTANNVVINKVLLKVLSGAGKVSFTSPTLPIAIGTLAPGASATVNLVLSVPKTVTNLAIIESGTMQDAQAKSYNFTLGEEVVP